LVGCLYHARRKFVEITKVIKSKEGVAHDVLKYIAHLARIEEEIKELSAEGKFEIRLKKTKPILDELHAYLTAMHPRIPPKSPLGQAVFYVLMCSSVITKGNCRTNYRATLSWDVTI
jgi:transposase